MNEFTPQEVNRFKKWLENQEKNSINPYVRGELSLEIISLVFKILQEKLDIEFEKASKEFASGVGK